MSPCSTDIDSEADRAAVEQRTGRSLRWPLQVVHRPEACRFEAAVEGRTALCAYRRVAGVLHLVHTEVPPALEGRGIAAALVREALAWARREGLRVRPACSYVAAYMRRHSDTQDLLA